MFTSLFQLEQKPVTVFSATDAGAPVLTADPGSLKTLLKACLVTGYGSKQGLGWQMAFESTDKNAAAFKSADPTASGFYFKIDNSTTNTAKLSAYQTMTDINTGAKSLVVDNIYKLVESNWKLIGHSKAFVLLVDITGNYGKYALPLLFGDLPREKKRVEPVCVLWCGRQNNYTAGLQNTIFAMPNGSSSNNNSYNSMSAYAMVINAGASTHNLGSSGRAFCRFRYDSFASANSLYEPIFCCLPDGTWTFLPMLQPMSLPLNDVVNLGLITNTTIKAKTGDYQNTGYDNSDCAVPADWWYA